MIELTWVGIGILAISNGVIVWQSNRRYRQANNKYSISEAKHLGKLEGKVDGLGTRMESLETKIGTIERRIDRFLENWPGNISD